MTSDVAPAAADEDLGEPFRGRRRDELVETARRCEAAGAGLIHIHVRDREHRPTLDAAYLRDAVVAVREATDRIMAAITGLLEELRGEQAPAVRFDPKAAGIPETGNFTKEA